MKARTARRIATTAGLAAALSLLGAGCSSSETASSGDQPASTTTTAAPVNAGAQVIANEFAFEPTPETIKAGQTVTWKNDGSSTHQVGAVADPAGQRLFSSDPLRPGDTFVFSFAQPGTYEYLCVIHPERMKGSVVVAP
jgi:plastocyanin